ncbi:MAG: hypothetical protein QOG67_2816 [Verrucomicrobiota bacterium]|jgi:hypothetical protein
MKIQLLRTKEAGSTIALSMLVIVVLGGFVALAVDYTNNIGRNAQRDRIFNNAVEIGDGCISEAFAAWRQVCKASSIPNPPTSAFSGVPSPSPGNFPSFPGATIANYSVQAVDPLVTLSSSNPPTSALPIGSLPPQATGPGTGTFSYFYLASADVTMPSIGATTTTTLTAKVRRIFEKRYTSPWNWAMMYNGNLELHPDAGLNFNGWVHSNANVYVGNGSSDPAVTPASTLAFTDRLTYQGNYSVGFDPNDAPHAGYVNVATPTYDAGLPPGHEQYYSLFGWDTTKFNTTDGNSDNDGYHELVDKPSTPWVSGTPSPAGDPFKDQRIYNQAYNDPTADGKWGIVISVDGTSKMSIGYEGATYTSQPNGNSPQSSAWAAAAAAIGANASTGVVATSSIQDNRESATVRTVNFDVAQWMTKSLKDPFNGIIYINDTSANSTTHRAVRIVNGSTLPSTGLTIASPNPVYIQGDFNSGRTSTVEPPSNTGNPSNPDASGYTHVPASVIADAITLLSNSWNDSNSSAGLSSRIASNTTVNAALVAGNVASDGSHYSGGGENFVRFLEDWSSKTFTYYGSMICPYASTQGAGFWGSGNVYLPPTQNWFFDTKLSVDSSGNPVSVPGYVSTVAYLQQQRWYLQY